MNKKGMSIVEFMSYMDLNFGFNSDDTYNYICIMLVDGVYNSSITINDIKYEIVIEGVGTNHDLTFKLIQ